MIFIQREASTNSDGSRFGLLDIERVKAESDVTSGWLKIFDRNGNLIVSQAIDPSSTSPVKIPQGDGYKYSVYDHEDSSVAKKEGAIAVGVSILIAGQSNAEYFARAKEPFAQTGEMAGVYDLTLYDRSGKTKVNTAVEGGGAALLGAALQKMMSDNGETGVPIAIINAAEGGTSVLNSLGKDKNDYDRTWKDTPKNLIDRMQAYVKAATGGKTEFAVWNQGESDVGSLATRQKEIEAGLKNVFEQINKISQNGVTIQGLGRQEDPLKALLPDAYRQFQADLAESLHLEVVPTLLELELGDWIHLSNTSYSWIGLGLAQEFYKQMTGNTVDLRVVLPSSQNYTGTAGSDYVRGSAARDTIAGGGDRDVLMGALGDDSVAGGDGDDLLSGGAGADTLNGGAGRDDLFGDQGNDLIHAGSEADYASGRQGQDTIFGEAGKDTLAGGEEGDWLDGGDDNDSLTGDVGDDTLIGGAGNDIIIDGEGADSIDGSSGIDWIDYSTKAGRRVTVDLTGGYANQGDGYTDTIIGVENIRATGLVDVLTGNSEANRFDALSGNDWVNGMGGNDTLNGGFGNDYLIGGLDTETLGISDDDNLDGQEGDDTLDGGAGADRLMGGTGRDLLSGGSGKDTLLGGTDDDTLSGGADSDILTGGFGADVFVFKVSDLTSGQNTISDFEVGDKLRFIGASGWTFSGNTAQPGAFKVSYSGGWLYINSDGDPDIEAKIKLSGSGATKLNSGNFDFLT